MKDVKLGNLLIKKIEELDGQFPMQVMLPDITADDLTTLKKWYWSDELSLDPENAALKLSIHSYLLQVNGLNILIDTCNGNNKSRSMPHGNMLDTNYLTNLKNAGVTPEEINIVLCTHLHCDHVGWNTRLENGEWIPTFPNARYIFSRKDYEFFITQQHEAMHREAFDDSVLPIVEAGLADIVEEDYIVDREIGKGVWLEGANGHSPGSCVVVAQDEGPKAVFSGDIFHHPVQLVNQEAPFYADEDFQQASLTRKAVLEKYADTDAVIFPAHFCDNSAGTLSTTDHKGYRFNFLEE